jgi:probable DNA metabolism protein
MHHWSIIDTTYLYDGTLEGLLNVVYVCFKDKQIPRQITFEEEYMPNLFELPRRISTNYEVASEVIQKIRSKTSGFTLHHVYYAYLSCNLLKEETIVHYLVYAFKYGSKINGMKSLDSVIEIQRICNAVKGEAHRFLGFIRFRELTNGFLYAEYASDNDILHILAEHFSERLKQEIWMIHDKKREQVALYNRTKFIIVDASTIDISTIENSAEDVYLTMWKQYFKTISITERENRRCQRSFMPKKYWQYLPETKQD